MLLGSDGMRLLAEGEEQTWLFQGKCLMLVLIKMNVMGGNSASKYRVREALLGTESCPPFVVSSRRKAA